MQEIRKLRIDWGASKDIIKAQLSLCLANHYVMKMYVEVDV
jgi:hypothetical protein